MANITNADKEGADAPESKEEIIARLKRALEDGSMPKGQIIAEWKRATQCTNPTIGNLMVGYALGGVALFMGGTGLLIATGAAAETARALVGPSPVKEVLIGVVVTSAFGLTSCEFIKQGFSLCRKTTAMWKTRNAPALKQG